MPDSINIAVSSLVAFQRAISTVGNNIANANTPGYSRQTVDLSPLASQKLGAGYVGSGVTISGIVRATDVFATAQVRSTQAAYSEQNTFYLNANQVDLMLADQSSSLANGLQDFFQAMGQVTEAPLDKSARYAMLSQAKVLVGRFQSMYSRLDQQGTQIRAEISAVVTEVNRLASNIAEINNKVIGSTRGAPDLLDLRDRMIDELSQYVDVSVVEQSNGAVNISIGTGQVLVINSGSIPMDLQPNLSDPLNFDVVLVSGASKANITKAISGGQLGGLLRFRDEIILPIQNTIGQIALGLTEAVNQQHQLGMDLHGDLGGNFFSDLNLPVLMNTRSIPNPLNPGTGVFSISIDDTSALMASDYTLNVAPGPQYILTRLSDNTSTIFNSFPQSVDGMTISLASGALASGDSFEIIPTRNAASQIGVNITDVNDIAVALPIRAQQSLNNVGTGKLINEKVIDTENPAFTTALKSLSPPIRIEFTSSTTYQLVDSSQNSILEGPINFVPGQVQSVFPSPGGLDYGYRIDLSGSPSNGDVFTIDYNTGGYADNRNGLLLGSLQTSKLISNHSASYEDIYSGLIAKVGSEAGQAKANQETGQLLLEQAQNQRDGITGVNLDEEAAKLLEFQHAYQAAGQVLSMSSRLFDVLFSALGR